MYGNHSMEPLKARVTESRYYPLEVPTDREYLVHSVQEGVEGGRLQVPVPRPLPRHIGLGRAGAAGPGPPALTRVNLQHGVLLI